MIIYEMKYFWMTFRRLILPIVLCRALPINLRRIFVATLSRNIREEREKIKQDKSRIFDHLEWANKEVKLRGDKVQKLRSGVSYHRKEEIEDQARKLHKGNNK